jgi:hypothetical protein
MFYIAIILWIAMIVLAGAALLTENYRAAKAGGAVLCLVLGFGSFAWSGIHSVPAKSLGVPVSLGHVGHGFYTSGAHETWDPFLHLAVVNETIQTTTFEQGSGLPGTRQCDGELPVRIGGQQSACARVSIQWRVRPDAASTLFGDFANQGDLMTTIENALVIRRLEIVVNNVIGEYDPITDYRNVVNTKTNNSQFSGFAPAILTAMKADIGSQIEVLSIFLPPLTYSASVENKLQQIQQAYANYAIAQENIQVNDANSKAFAKLGNPTVPQLIAQCLNDSRENHTSPMGCFPGQASGLQISK